MVIMTNPDITPGFKEVNPDTFVLTADKDFALGAAWKVLRALENNQYGEPRIYTDDFRDNTLAYLSDGGEERPISGIFGVSIRESYAEKGESDLVVLNQNGKGNEEYRAQLKAVVDALGAREE